MRKLLVALAAVTCLAGFTTAPAAPAAADSVKVAGTDWSVALTFQDLQWSSGVCQFVTVKAEVLGSSVAEWTFGGFVELVKPVAPVDEDDEYEADGGAYIDYDTKVRSGTGRFTLRHGVLMCPSSDSAGTYEVIGDAGVRMAGSNEWLWEPYRTTFTLSGVPSATRLESIKRSGERYDFRGRVTIDPAADPNTIESCGGGVRIEYLQGEEWEETAWTEVLPDGSFLGEVRVRDMESTQYRATYNGGRYCASSSSAALAMAVRIPSVNVTTDRRSSKLIVDIDPNKGRRYWVFQVQRSRDDGSWRTLRTYRTKGAKETRTINVTKGDYRVRVKARFGYQETWSDSVWIDK
jgi:hypothetical protein